MSDPIPQSEGRLARFLPELALMAITLIWGVSFLVIKLALLQGGALGLVALRFAIGGAALILAPGFSRPTGAEVRAGALIGVVLFLGYGLQAEGLTTIASSRSGFFTALYVPLVPLVQFCLFRKRPGLGASFGILLACAGLVLLAHPAGLGLHLARGDWLTIFCALAVAFEIVLIGRFAPHGNPVRLAAVQMVTVALLALLAMLATGETVPGPAAWPAFWLGAAALGIATAGIMAIMNWAQRTVAPLRATLIYTMEPVWAGIVGALAGDPMDAATLSGAGLIVAGVLAGTLVRRRG